MPNLPRTTAAGRNYLALFAAHTIHVYLDPGQPRRPGNGVSRPALDRLVRDGLVQIGDYRPTYGRPVHVTDLGRAVLGAHLSSTVPAELRSWSVTWPGYRPVDLTPPELRAKELAQQVPDWAEAAATPADVDDWAERRHAALVPFELDGRGWPLHPAGRTGRTGRNLGKWGENAAADPIVIAGTGSDRRVLLITRDDIHQEAIPGGMVDPGETAPAALVRELREETGVDLSNHQPVILGRDLVDDHRQSDHAWVASTSALFVLPATVTATAADDALDATWYPAGSMADLENAITAAGRTLYAAHRPLLQRALTRLAEFPLPAAGRHGGPATQET